MSVSSVLFSFSPAIKLTNICEENIITIARIRGIK